MRCTCVRLRRVPLKPLGARRQLKRAALLHVQCWMDPKNGHVQCIRRIKLGEPYRANFCNYFQGVATSTREEATPVRRAGRGNRHIFTASPPPSSQVLVPSSTMVPLSNNRGLPVFAEIKSKTKRGEKTKRQAFGSLMGNACLDRYALCGRDSSFVPPRLGRIPKSAKSAETYSNPSGSMRAGLWVVARVIRVELQKKNS